MKARAPADNFDLSKDIAHANSADEDHTLSSNRPLHLADNGNRHGIARRRRFGLLSKFRFNTFRMNNVACSIAKAPTGVAR